MNMKKPIYGVGFFHAWKGGNMTPLQWRDMTIGKQYDIDGAYGPQCWDYFAYFVKYFGLPLDTKCSITGYVCDLWRLKDQYGYSTYFEYITDPSRLQIGDWVIWDRGSSHSNSHVAMMTSNGGPVELGQNQGYPYVTEKPTTWDMLGAFRFRSWGSISIGCSDMEINGHSYSLYRQGGNEVTVVLSAGIDKVDSIRKLDADVYVMAKITGANYFQMKQQSEDQPDPLNTTYGDLSSPLNDVWTEVPNQDSTLYFDIETGSYGDCTGIHIDPTHNVFSPGCVFPASGNYQYGRFIGIGCVNIVSRYTFLIRFKDGTYAVGIANQDLTPKQIAADMKVAASDLESISFLDGGGSAQMGRWNGNSFEYVRDTGREVPSAVAIVSTTPIPDPAPEIPAESDDSHESEEETMPEEKPSEQPEMTPVEGWTDPESQTNIIVQRIAALMSVKSVITIALTVAFIVLVVNGKDLPDQFVSIYTMCISFFFGYQFKKAEKE